MQFCLDNFTNLLISIIRAIIVIEVNGMRGRKNDVNPGDVIFIIIFFGVIGFFLIKWILIVIIFLIALIISFFTWLYKKKENHKEEQNQDVHVSQIQDSSIASSSFKEEVIYKTKYDDLFPEQIRNNGVDYYLNDKITNYRKLKTKCTCISKGTEDYKTEIFIDNNKEFKRARCTCPYFQDGENFCKHIYGLLFMYCIDERIPSANPEPIENDNKAEDKIQLDNSENIYSEIVNATSELESLINEVDMIYQFNQCDDMDIEAICSEIDTYKDNLQKYSNLRIIDISEDILDSINNDIDAVQDIMNDLESRISDLDDAIEDDRNKERLGTALGAGAALHFLNENKRKEKQGKDIEKEHQQLKDVWGLSDYEANLVQQGKYNPWSFGNDKEDLEEDDYHYEDDI